MSVILRPGKSSAIEASSLSFDGMTRVELIWLEKQTEFWIRFGNGAGEQVLDRSRRVVFFMPGSVFAFVRWASNDYGTVVSRIDIVRAVAPGSACQTLPSVRPGGEILLKIEGWPKVEEVLRHIDAIESLGIDPAEADPDHWRHVAHWMKAGEEPQPYTAVRHDAWLRRRGVSTGSHSASKAPVELSKGRTQ